MLTNTIIKNANCIEHVLCNILRNMGLDYSMLFTDSWSIFVDKDTPLPLRDRLDIYHPGYYELFENLKGYYGVDKELYAWPDNYQELQALVDAHEYLCLRIKTAACPWLIAIEGMEEYHYLLVTGVDGSGLYGYDYSSVSMKKLSLENLEKGALEFLSFHKIQDKVNTQEYERDVNRKLREKAETHRLSENICLLAEELDDGASVLSELSYGDLIISPLLRKISYIGFGRQNFLVPFQRGAFIDKFDLEEETERLLEISKRWLFLNKLFTKYALAKNEEILQKIKRYLQSFSVEEETLLDRFIMKMGKERV